MPILSPMRESVPVLPGLKLLGRGKVRDTYEISERLLLIVATDGISIFDFVLNALVPEKGAILTAMSHFWLTKIEKELGIETHLVAAGAAIDKYLPSELQGNPELQSRAMVVRRLKMADVEFVARGFLTGSGLKSYNETGEVCGIKLHSGYQDGDVLTEGAIATPTTKAQEGHDEAMDAATVREKFPEETALLLKIYSWAMSEARQNGILIADTKFEFGCNEDGKVILGDEALTPDSSRFWEFATWKAAQSLETRKAPPPYDKQLIRNAGIGAGINKLDPLKTEDILKAQSWQVPLPLIEATIQTYRYIFWRLTGMSLEKYQREVLNIANSGKRRSLAIVFGSESDIPAVREAMIALRQNDFFSGIAEVKVHVISCHRNPNELRQFAAHGHNGADVIIAAGSKAFALPGVLDATLHSMGKNIPVIGVALGEVGSKALEAARLSISELPGQPVVMDEAGKCVYEGNLGFMQALERAADGEFPFRSRTVRPAQFNIDLSTLA